MTSKSKHQGLSGEYYYASHHHLIPLYVLSGIAILALLVLGCFVAVLWQNNDRSSYMPAVNTTISSVENLYLPAAINPSEKKQYIYPSQTRFAITDPYDTLRYTYDPGMQGTPASSTITLTTSKTLQELEAPMLHRPEAVHSYSPKLQQCARLYVVRFEPGVTAYGGFAPFRDVKLNDGRTAYIHKNINCVPSTTDGMTTIEKVEKTILSIESY